MLREAAVANINPQKVKIDSILNELPDSVRDLVVYRITRTEMLNNLAAAETDDEKVSAMVVLGSYTRDPLEKEKIFWEVRSKYADHPESAAAGRRPLHAGFSRPRNPADHMHGRLAPMGAQHASGGICRGPLAFPGTVRTELFPQDGDGNPADRNGPDALFSAAQICGKDPSVVVSEGALQGYH